MKSLIKIERENIVPFIISTVFHPLFVPVIGVSMILSSNTYNILLNDGARLYVTLLVLGFTIVVPLLLLPLYYYIRLIKSVDMTERNERIIPLVFNALIYYGTYSFFKNQQVLIFVNLFLLAITTATVAATIITWFWKISLHAIAWGGLLALALIMALVGYLPSLNLLFGVILATGIVATARLYMQKHSLAQVYWGLALGFFMVVFFLVFFLGMFPQAA